MLRLPRVPSETSLAPALGKKSMEQKSRLVKQKPDLGGLCRAVVRTELIHVQCLRQYLAHGKHSLILIVIAVLIL